MLEKQIQKDSIKIYDTIPIITIPRPIISSIKKIQNKNQLDLYKEKYHHLSQENNQLRQYLSQVIRDKQILQIKYNNIYNQQAKCNEVELGERGGQCESDRKKRIRRVASQIIRQYDCCLQKCGKSYGTQASLVQHIKLKHSNIYASKQYQNHIINLRKKIDGKGQKNTVVSPVIKCKEQVMKIQYIP